MAERTGTGTSARQAPNIFLTMMGRTQSSPLLVFARDMAPCYDSGRRKGDECVSKNRFNFACSQRRFRVGDSVRVCALVYELRKEYEDRDADGYHVARLDTAVRHQPAVHRPHTGDPSCWLFCAEIVSQADTSEQLISGGA